MTKIWPWRGPLSRHEGKVLIAANTKEKYKYNGPCCFCGDLIKIATLSKTDRRCVECQYHLSVKKKRRWR